jgi:hypothetical protein
MSISSLIKMITRFIVDAAGFRVLLVKCGSRMHSTSEDMMYRLKLYEYRFYYREHFGISEHCSILATSCMRAKDKLCQEGNLNKLDLSLKFARVERHVAIYVGEYNEDALCAAQSWDSLMGGL